MPRLVTGPYIGPGDRNFDCVHYDECLSKASRRLWPNFFCPRRCSKHELRCKWCEQVISARDWDERCPEAPFDKKHEV